MIDLKRNLFKIDVRAQKDEEKVFMRTAWKIGFFLLSRSL
ncbi:exfoliative toxin [Streptococcus agalactiae]|nr:exfoliative toxin [Streptococcus agalactiae]